VALPDNHHHLVLFEAVEDSILKGISVHDKRILPSSEVRL